MGREVRGFRRAFLHPRMDRTTPVSVTILMCMVDVFCVDDKLSLSVVEKYSTSGFPGLTETWSEFSHSDLHYALLA